MNVEAKDFELKMTYGELWSLAYNIQHSIEYSLKSHYVNHQDKWIENEKESLRVSKQFFLALGRPELHENIFAKAEEIFKEFNANKTQLK